MASGVHRGACIGIALAIAALAPTPALAAPNACRHALANGLPGVQITAISEIDSQSGASSAATRVARDLDLVGMKMSPFCRVVAIVSPIPNSHIGIELWLPRNWNGKLLALGNHGFAGEYERGYMAMGLERGYAVVTTDTGHSSRDIAQPTNFRQKGIVTSGFNIGSAAFASNPAALDDFAWRAVHEMAVTAKVLARRYYGTPARRAYFEGCSTGGRQGMREVQQFPGDFDGVIAGGAPMNWTRIMVSQLNFFLAGALPSGGRVSMAKLALAQKGAVAACDVADGLRDGVVADPERCHFDQKRVICRAGQDSADCLTGGEAAVVKRLETPFRNPRNGAALYAPFPPGGESHWVLTQAFSPIAEANFRYLVMNDPTWAQTGTTDPWSLLALSERPGSPGLAINSINPDLSAFHARGGKLIQYHGWSDEAMPAVYYPQFYGEVVDLQPGRDKLAQTQSFYRLFMVPGMTHCFGGDGPVNFGALNHVPSPVRDADHDVLEALDRWVEKGQAPERIVATEFTDDRTVKRQMPLCAWPKVAIYAGGKADRAASFACIRRGPGAS